MTLIQILYSVAAIVAIGAGIPQLHQLIVTKDSDEFSLSTWTTWFATQSITAVYFVTLGSVLATIVSSAWVLFYAMMIALIVYYRSPVMRCYVKHAKQLFKRKQQLRTQEVEVRTQEQ